MDTRSDNDIVIEYTVRLERLLKESYGATGNGFGQLITSVADRLPDNLVREGRRLAAMRNRVVHEHVPLENRRDFIRRCERLEKKLSQLAPNQPGEIGERRSAGAALAAWLAFASNHLYWPLLVLCVVFAGRLVVDGLAHTTDLAGFFSYIAKIYPLYLFYSSMVLATFLFFKNLWHIGWLVSAFLSILLSPIFLAMMVWTPSLFGTSIAAFLLAFFSLDDAPAIGAHALNAQSYDSATAAAYAAVGGKVVIGLELIFFYALSSIHRHFYGRASGHAAAALFLYFFGMKTAGLSVMWAAPLALLAFVDIYGLARDGRLMAWPKDPVWEPIKPSTRQQRREPSMKNSGDGEEDAVRSPFQAERPRYNFSHVVGMSELKARLGEVGREIVKARRRGVAARNGILLYGPPGTGKTFFAEALAGELKLKIIKANFGLAASRWVNQTTEQVMAVFREAEQQAPVVLFMDEIDTILIDRSKVSNADSEAARLVSAFLPAIERLRDRGVVVIGATNLLDQLDPAAIREGRFDFKIEVPYPDEEARFAILKDRVIKNGLTTHSEVLKRLARRWKGFSVARLQAIVDEASRENAGAEVGFDDFMAALRKVQGRKGARGEGGPTLEQLTLSPRMREDLNDLASRMKNIEAIERLGGTLPRGILFYGPPGTGKTFTARALANSADWAFLATTGHDLLANPKKIDEIMRDANDLRPCIVFIDEADDVFGHRGFSRAASITNKLLTAMDGANGQVHDVVFIAATNHPDNFDPAALRGGRFTEKVEFELPDQETLRDHVQKWIDTARISTHPDLSAQSVAELLLGHPLATVNEVLQAAVNRMASKAATRGDDRVMISMEDIREGFRRVVGEMGA